MKYTAIAAGICTVSLSSSMTFAAGLDRSGQSINAFLQPNNYAEASYSALLPSVKGANNSGSEIGNMADNYSFLSAAIKVQANEQLSVGMLYDQPFGADATYDVDSGTFDANGEGTQVKVRTHNITALIGYQPTKNWNVYAGPVLQTVEADISLRGQGYAVLSGYDIDVDQKEAWGWLAGAAYSIPEIALKAAVTYRSEINHKAESTESSNIYLSPSFDLRHVQNRLSAVTPQSVNIDFQTGVAENTLAFANIRWVHWDQFVVSPVLLGKLGQDLISYEEDQWSINMGLGHKFNDKWSGSASVGWDSGAGNPVTTLGPTNGYWSIGLGGQYSPTQKTFVQAGVKYYDLGDAKAQTGGAVKGSFENNHAVGYGIKVGYKF